MVKYILIVMAFGQPAPAPVAEFYEKVHCELAAYQLSTHPQNKGRDSFTCEKYITL